MKKLIYVFLFLGVMPLYVSAQREGIVFFEGTWAKVIEKAKKENKQIFLDCYGEWCGPCKYMEKYVFTQKKLGDFYNAHFINVKIDIKKGEGIELAKKYAVNFLPTLLIINTDGYKINQLRGKREANELIAWGKEVIKMPATLTLEERFDKGMRDDAFMSKYLDSLIKDRQLAKLEIILNKIIEERGYEILYHKVYFDLLSIVNVDSPAVKYFVKNSATFTKTFSEDIVNAKISDIYLSYKQLGTLFNRLPPHSFNEEAYHRLIKKMTGQNLANLEFLTAEVDFYVACLTGGHEKAYQIGEQALKNENVAWKYYIMAKMANMLFQKNYRIIAAQWAEKAANLAKDETMKKECTKIQYELSAKQIQN